MTLVVVCSTVADIQLRPAWAGDLENKVKSAYIYNFTKFVDWQEGEGGTGREPLRICIVGNDPIRTVLGELSNREANGRPLLVQRIKDLKTVGTCSVAFISRSEEQQLPSILQRLNGVRTLTVSDIPQFAQKGGMIGFVTEGGRVKLEINLRAIRQTGLKVSAKLLEVARVVE
jgi:hypothetical protein